MARLRVRYHTHPFRGAGQTHGVRQRLRRHVVARLPCSSQRV